MVTPVAPEDVTYTFGESFDLQASVDDPTKQYRLYWDFDASDGVTFDAGETGETVEDANFYFPQPGSYVCLLYTSANIGATPPLNAPSPTGARLHGDGAMQNLVPPFTAYNDCPAARTFSG